MTMSRLEDFEDYSIQQRALENYMKGKEMSLSDAMMYSLVSSLLTAASPKVPTGSIESEWDSDNYAISSIKRKEMYVRSRVLVQKDGMAFSVIRKILVAMCGSAGPNLYVRDTNGDEAGVHKKATPGELWLKERVADLLPSFNKTARLVVGQTLINGDLYALHFPLGGGKTNSHPQLRIVLPDRIVKERYADGWSLTGPSVQFLAKVGDVSKWINADEVTDFHVNEELHDGRHGISIPYFLLAELPRYLDWLEQRVLKARTDNLALVIRYMNGATSLKKRELPDRPMQIDAAMDAEKWETLNLGGNSSRDAVGGDGYEFRLRLAAALGLPEHLVTGNAQYAAQMGKDGIPVALFEYYQEGFSPGLVTMGARTLGCKESALGLNWGQVDLSNREGRLREVMELHKETTISNKEVCRQLRYDYELNQKEIKEELRTNMMVGPSTGTGSEFDMSSLGMLPSMDVGASPIAANPEGANVTLPSGMVLKGAVPPDSFAGRLIEVGGESAKLGLTTDCIVDEIPKLDVVGAGADYGYALGGAIVLGGLTADGNIIMVGEATMMRVDNEGWGSVLDGMRQQFPGLKEVFTGSDEPALTDYLSKKGYKAEAKHLGEERTRVLVDAFLKAHKIEIYYQCRELLSDMFGPQLDQATGMHLTGGRPDHLDAARYLIIGLMEKLGEISKEM